MSKVRVDATRPVDDALESIANPLARATVTAMADLEPPVSVDDLAAAVVDEVAGTDDVAAEYRESVEVRLRHTGLPKLESADLLAWDGDGAAVEPTDHPALSDPRFLAMAAVDADDWEDVLVALSTTRRRHALAVLRSVPGDADRRALVRRVLADESGVAPDEVRPSEVEETLVAFHHVHLPALERAGLVSLDDDRVAYDGHPALDPEWLAVGVDRPERPTRGGGSPPRTPPVDRERLVAPGGEGTDQSQD